MKTDLKKLRNITVAVAYPLDDRREERTIKGYRVVVMGFEEYDFYVHRGIDIFNEDSWRITESTTGFAFPAKIDSPTRQGAIDNITQFLAVQGENKLIEVLKRVKEDITK